jgi:hypothetical protein
MTLEHFKRKEQYVNIICFSHIGVCGLPLNEGRQRACAKSRPQRCSGSIRKRYFLFEYASYYMLQFPVVTLCLYVLFAGDTCGEVIKYPGDI